MRRIYACIAIVAVLLMAAFYSSWKVQHFAEEIFSDIDTAMEASLRAADGHLEMNAAEEAFGELRRAQVQVETMEWLARRIL